MRARSVMKSLRGLAALLLGCTAPSTAVRDDGVEWAFDLAEVEPSGAALRRIYGSTGDGSLGLVPLGRSSARFFFPFGAIRFNHGA